MAFHAIDLHPEEGEGCPVEIGLLRPLVALRVPLEDIARAHEAIERGANGKVFVDLVAERQPNGVQDEFASREIRSASA